MALLHPASVPATLPELNLFDLPPTQTAVDSIYYVETRPVSQVNGSNGPVEFCFGGESRDYIDLSRSRMKVKVQIIQEVGTPLVAKELAVPVNLALHSMWSQVDVTLGGRLMSQATGLYPYKSMIQTLLNFDSESKTTQLVGQGFYKDEKTGMDSVVVGKNDAVFAKNELFSMSKTVDFEGPLLEDVLQLKRHLLNNIEVGVKLYPSQSSFLIMAADTTKKYKMKLVEASFKVCMVRVSPGITLGHAHALETRNALYPYTNCETKTYSIPKDSSSVNIDNVFQYTRPSKLVFGLVSAEAFNGSFTKKNFNFKHYGVTDVAVVVDGETIPGRPLKLDFASTTGRDYITPYLHMFEATGTLGMNVGNGITPEDFANGQTLFVFNLDPQAKKGKYLNLIRRANVRIELRFASPLIETVNIIVYAEHPALIEVDKVRNVMNVRH